MSETKLTYDTAALGTVRPVRRTLPHQRVHVLLIASAPAPEPVIVRTFGRACFEVDLATTMHELRHRSMQHHATPYDVVFLDLELSDFDSEQPARTVQMVQGDFSLAKIVSVGGSLNGEEEAELLTLGVASLQKPVSLDALAVLAVKLTFASESPSQGPPSAPLQEAGRPLECVVESYAADRGFSRQQQRILTRHLKGESDKEIAHSCGCRITTVYEHWRRMTKKVGGLHKQHVIADFHRFIGAA